MNRVSIEFYVKGEEDAIATYDWPAVPRLGESVFLGADEYVVVVAAKWSHMPGHANTCWASIGVKKHTAEAAHRPPLDRVERYIDDSVHLSNKSCREAYQRGGCGCPIDRCWYGEQKRRRAAGAEAIAVEHWRAELGS